MFAIAVATFKESLRKRIFLLIGILTIIYLILLGVIIHYSLSEMAKWNRGDNLSIYVVVTQLISVLGFYFSSMLTAFLAIMMSVGCISSEIESGVIHSIITRPIKRSEYILGKYLGLSILISMYSILLYALVLLICSILKLPVITSISTVDLFKGLLLFILQPIAILSISIWGSSHFKTLPNGILIIGIYIMGLIGGFMEQIGSAIKNQSLINWGIMMSLISPFDVIYRKLVSTIFPSLGLASIFSPMGSMSGGSPSTWMMVYIFIYIIGFIYFSMRYFSKKDIS
ncbi:ABC-2 family transporter protein [Oxobacter pfennigii]|uniref:ABC-2 family transporter protein n=1 Tax=Oxobacter pfennigii TaxID=36849 RepID=A0A0P8WJZ0_9CLOT|nr:ABC transporter permease subunit [Oxobacter pfennigii]KPU42503.1 ABC-2 family transporter protein [Oxobacter pfennigii]